ncbi:MAG: membrane-associated protein [Parcubacteria group bacterium Greene0714_36]|nr:MAG: membrane-associated protein [Parcubacteria group bacterium Greene0714_36]
MFDIDLVRLIETVGYLGLFAIVFAESGLFVGFFLPGDSLLFTAGFLASQGYGSIALLVIGCFAAAVLGDSFGYGFGRRVGPRIFTKDDSFFFRKAYVARTQEFYNRHGGKTLILARFMPVMRTLAPIFAGVGNMPYRTFLFYNVIGGLLWAVGLTVLGYALGSVIPGIDRYLIPIVLVIIITSALPPLLHVVRDQMKMAQRKNKV